MKNMVRVACVALLLAAPAAAHAHATTFAMYSKYEATVVGNDIAFVFALDKGAVLRLFERDAAAGAVDVHAVERYKSDFSRYLFARFFVSNDGAACTHPAELGRFFFDDATGRVLAVTRFHCATEPAALTIRSLVTHDLPLPHELVGDLQYRHALVRSFFSGDDVEAKVALAALSQSAALARTRGKFSYVALPDRERRYSALAAIELGVALRDEAASDVRPLATLWHFIGQGVLHILTGYDHLLFILTLMLAVGSWRRLAIIITSFTAAHSITLVVATLGLFTIPARVIEPLIALSVLLVAADALLRPQAHARAAVTFAFGLLHGFGLSNVLRDLGLSGRALLPALLGFNAGVELGQLAVVACAFPLILLLRRRRDTYVQARRVLCGSVAVAALCWIVVRVGG
jgi:hydrogenase/urease accessory protein HupE